MGLKSTILKVAIGGLRFIYAPMKLRKLDNQIVIISRQSNHPTLDIKLLRDYMAENYPSVKCKVLCAKLEQYGAVRYGFHMLHQMWEMSRSKVVLIDGYCIAASVLNHKKGTIIIQMWHALAAIKKFGYQTIDKPAGHSRVVAETMCMHRNYDYVIAASEATGKHFGKCFNVTRDKLVYLGLPRIDEILSPHRILPQEYREQGVCAFEEAIRNEYDISWDREILLYVPTFRKGANVNLEGIIEATNSDRFTLVIKAHPLYDDMDMGRYQDDINTNVQVIVDKRYTSYQWLSICDRVITDYSALGVEAALLDKPLYYYVYDIEEYKKNVGLNVEPLDEMPQATAVTPEELSKLLNDEYNMEKLIMFRNKYISIDKTDCTRQLSEFLVGLMS